MKYLFLPYHLFRFARHIILLSVFGSVSYCKHTPSCSLYMQQSIQTMGLLKGSTKGLARLARCW